MKRFLALSLLTAALLALMPWVLRSLPAPPEGLAGKRYEGFAGVLRLWTCREGWQPGAGSFTAWLSDGISRFERGHKGVYVAVTPVSRETLAAFAGAQVAPPDVLLFPPGVLEEGAGLLALDGAEAIRADLAPAGVWAESQRALPAALGGYALCLNRALLPGTPADWSAAGLLSVPGDDAFHAWSAVLPDLLAPLPPAPTEPAGDLESVYRAFVGGRCGAMPVTQREIRRLEALTDSGRGPDAWVEGRPLRRTDQVMFLAATDVDRPHGTQRQALSRALIALFLSEEVQGKLSLCGAFRADGGEAVYRGGGMGEMEKALAGPLAIPPAFGKNPGAER